MQFKQFVIRLADQIGRHHIPVNDRAQEIGEFIGADAVHCELAPRVIRAIYKANRCGFLGAAVSAEATFDALGKIQGDLLRCQNTDLDQVSLLAQLGEHAARILDVTGNANDESGRRGATTPDEPVHAATSAVVTFSRR